MNLATLTTRTLQVDGMTGDTCIAKVTAALKGVPDVTTRSVKVGSATVECDQEGCDAACATIGSAGYKARDGAPAGGKTPAGDATDPKNPAQKPRTDHTGEIRDRTPGGNPVGNATKPQAGSPNADRPSGDLGTTPSKKPEAAV